tara:strand:- start:669 stop:1316 length:648 start_codon:yes stop_codon:yes gene_type:complete
MIKDDREEIINDIKSKRDAIALNHQQLKNDSDSWNKAIILMSLITGGIESIKMKLELTGAGWSLMPILLSSLIAACSALIKFRDFNRKMEILIEANSRLTNILTKARNHETIDADLLHEYNDGLECIETSMYPNERKMYLRTSHKNLISIMLQERKYYGMIDKVNSGEMEVNASEGTGETDVLDITEHGASPSPPEIDRKLVSVKEEETKEIDNL